MSQYLASTFFIDHEDPVVRRFAESAVGDIGDRRSRAVHLFNAVRDGLWYDPYNIDLRPEAYRASEIIQGTTAYCVPKAILLAAAGRAVGLPTRLGYADVRNHLATPRLLEQLGTDVFAFHGYTEIYLDNRWIKATPTFNAKLCRRFGVEPLDFDGINDALFQPFDNSGQRHMEYIRDRGSFADFPYEEMLRVYAEAYPSLSTGPPESVQGSLFSSP